MKNIFLRLMNFQNGIIIVLAAVLTACIDKAETPDQNAIGFVTIYNAAPAPNGLALDVYYNGSDSKINQNPFEYSKNSGYLNMSIGTVTLTFNEYNTTTKRFESTFKVEENKAKSFFVINEGTELSALILKDSSGLATTTTAKLRFVNLSPNPDLKVDLHVKATDVTDSTLFEDISFKSSTQFNTIKPRTYTFVLLNSADGSELATLTDTDDTDTSIGAGKYYTIIARGFDPKALPAGNNNKIALQILRN